LKKIRPQYGAAGVGAHRDINALHGNGQRGRTGNAADPDCDRGRDEDNGEAAGCHRIALLVVRAAFGIAAAFDLALLEARQAHI
jgi:hypothetical protein